MTDKRLDLRGYVLNDHHCRAFSEAVKLHPDLLDSVILEENQFTDIRLGLFMIGICNLTKMKQIIIKNNEVLDETLEQLQGLLKRPFPDNLDELRLISVKTSPYMITDFVETLSENCLLKKLSLVQCCLMDSHLPHLLKMLDNSRFLIELDISWSQLTPLVLLELTRVLASNR